MAKANGMRRLEATSAHCASAASPQLEQVHMLNGGKTHTALQGQSLKRAKMAG